MLSLILNLLMSTASASQFDLFCETNVCTIPYNSEGAQNGVESCYTDESRKVKVKEITWKNGKREGPAKCWKNGKPSLEAEYKNDLLNGLFVEINDDTNGDRIRYLENGEEEGLSFSARDGKITAIHYCMKNKAALPEAILNCKAKNYGKYEKPLEVFKKDLETKEKLAAAQEAQRKNGPQTSKYPSGHLRAKWKNTDGQIHGAFVSYWDNGKLQSNCTFDHGKENGPCEYFNEQGFKTQKILWNKGKESKVEEYFDNGKIKRVSQFDSQNRKCVSEYYDTGTNLRSWCSTVKTQYWDWFDWDMDLMDGDYTEWDPDNIISLKGAYSHGERKGIWQYYQKNILDLQLFYEKGSVVKSIQYIRKSPTHRIVEEYFPDGSLKSQKIIQGLE